MGTKDSPTLQSLPQANFFDLSPANTAGKYTAKKGVDGVEGLIHKTIKMAKMFQPSIVFIGEAASIFLKKKPKVREGAGGEQKQYLNLPSLSLLLLSSSSRTTFTTARA